MALIKCPECGREISDRAEECPGCGCPERVLHMAKIGTLYDYFSRNGLWEDYREWVISQQEKALRQDRWSKEPTEILDWVSSGAFDRIADEIFWEKPRYVSENGDKLSKSAILSKKLANDLMKIREEYWQKIKNDKRIPEEDFCPICGGHMVERCEQINESGNVRAMRCLQCKYTWTPKRR